MKGAINPTTCDFPKMRKPEKHGKPFRKQRNFQNRAMLNFRGTNPRRNPSLFAKAEIVKNHKENGSDRCFPHGKGGNTIWHSFPPSRQDTEGGHPPGNDPPRGNNEIRMGNAENEGHHKIQRPAIFRKRENPKNTTHR